VGGVEVPATLVTAADTRESVGVREMPESLSGVVEASTT
jgi:hypothetical protein